MLKTKLVYILVFVVLSFKVSAQDNKLIAEDLDKTMYLIGDTGEMQNGVSQGMQALQSYFSQHYTKDAYLVFLGDNIYPNGFPSKKSATQDNAKIILDNHFEVIKYFKGQTVFIPGNHDWRKENIERIDNQKDYIKDNSKAKWMPKVSCGIDGEDISDDIYLLTIDSQWLLSDWDKTPKVNKKCNQIKTRAQFYTEFETELKKNQNKTVIVALHHPLLTNGVHGGIVPPKKHVFPLDKPIPVPGLASILAFARSSGVSAQDVNNMAYQHMKDRLTAIAKRWNKVIFASGHEHSLQLIEEDDIIQIVSGSGSKTSFVKAKANTQFKSSTQGFVKLDIYKNGKTVVKFYTSENGKPQLAYEKELFSEEKTFDKSQLKQDFPKFVQTSIYNKEDFPSKDKNSIISGTYRPLYTQTVKAKVALLDTLYGGLTPVRKGGGMQTKSLRLKDSQGREYNIRAIKKNASQILQSTVFQDQFIGDLYQDTLVEDLLKEILTGSHPYGFLAVPILAEATGVNHTNPELYYIPKQSRLGDYNATYGDEIYMIEERPEEHWVGANFFGSPNHDIESTDDVYEKLARDEKYSINENQYIKSRIFDMLIGDFDRHQDQWRWAEDELDNGNHVFQPIPRDRDQAFANFDSQLFKTLKLLSGFPKRFLYYKEDIQHPKHFHFNALPLDRTLLRNSSRKDWIVQAEYIQNSITPDIVNQAFERLPDELQDENTEALKAMLLKRKDNLKNIVNAYYDNLSEYTLLTATDKDDYIDIESDKNQLKVSMYRNKGGDREDKFSERVFKVEDTREIWLYGLQDDDTFTYSGTPNKIKIRLIGGHGNDAYNVRENGNHLKIYDHKSLENTIVKKANAKVKLNDNYVQNNFDKNRSISKINNFIPKIGFNVDDGFLIGATNVYTYKGFNLNPFTYKHSVSAGYYFETQGLDLDYEGEFAQVFGNYNLVLGGRFTSPNYAVNFFGFGNTSLNPEDEIDRDFNRVRYESVTGKLGLRKSTKYGSSFIHTLQVESIEVERTANRFLDAIADELLAEDPQFFDRKTFLGAQTEFNFTSLDDALNPSKGMNFDLQVGAKLNLNDSERAYAYLNPNLEFYNPLTADDRLVLRTQAYSEINFGNQFEFYQAASAGSDNTLRGYRRNRFLGQQSLIGSGDLRYSFNQFKTGVVPLQFGIFGGYDIGRVWSDVNSSNRWNDNYGGGVWFTAADLLQGAFNLFYGDDGSFFSFQVNVSL